jgi:hypothetical protein
MFKKKKSFSLLLKMYVLCMLRDRRRQDGDGRTDEEKNVHVWRVVLSYDSYLLTTEKTFLLFRRVSLVLSLFLSCLLVCLCVCPLLFSPARESKHCLLARARARARLLLLSPYVSLPHPLLVYYYYTSRLLLTIIHAFFCFSVGFFTYNTFTHNDEHHYILYILFLFYSSNDFYTTNMKKKILRKQQICLDTLLIFLSFAPSLSLFYERAHILFVLLSCVVRTKNIVEDLV